MNYKGFNIKLVLVKEGKKKYATLLARHKHVSIEAPYHLKWDIDGMEKVIDEFINRMVDV